MRLITLEFNVSEDVLETLLQDLEHLKGYWSSHGVRFQLFKDTAQKSRFFGTFLTEKSVDDVVILIQTDNQAKEIFDRLKNAGVHLVLSVLEELK
jgi:hypothetical protein